MITRFDRDVHACHDCRVWDPEHQPSVRLELERNPDAYADRLFITIETGSLRVLDLTVPLHTDFVLCAVHAARCVELYGPLKRR